MLLTMDILLYALQTVQTLHWRDWNAVRCVSIFIYPVYKIYASVNMFHIQNSQRNTEVHHVFQTASYAVNRIRLPSPGRRHITQDFPGKCNAVYTQASTKWNSKIVILQYKKYIHVIICKSILQYCSCRLLSFIPSASCSLSGVTRKKIRKSEEIYNIM